MVSGAHDVLELCLGTLSWNSVLELCLVFLLQSQLQLWLGTHPAYVAAISRTVRCPLSLDMEW